MSKKKKPRMLVCKRCKAEFATRDELEIHDIQMHKTKIAARELQLLAQGFIPEENKLGKQFKGKNKIIIL